MAKKVITKEYFKEKLLALDLQERAAIYAVANKWNWPKLFSRFKPKSWDRLSIENKARSDTFDNIFHAVLETTTPFQRSRAWWTLELGRTEVEHKAWWKTQSQRRKNLA